MFNKILLMTGVELRTSGIESDHSTNWATTTSHHEIFYLGRLNNSTTSHFRDLESTAINMSMFSHDNNNNSNWDILSAPELNANELPFPLNQSMTVRLLISSLLITVFVAGLLCRWELPHWWWSIGQHDDPSLTSKGSFTRRHNAAFLRYASWFYENIKLFLVAKWPRLNWKRCVFVVVWMSL